MFFTLFVEISSPNKIDRFFIITLSLLHSLSLLIFITAVSMPDPKLAACKNSAISLSQVNVI